MKLTSLGCLVTVGFFAGCGSDSDDESGDCEVDSVQDIAVQSVEINAGFSSNLCPEVNPSDLNSALSDAGMSPCELTLDNCVLSVACDLGVATGGGELDYADGQFTGTLLVSDPIDCAYEVVASP